MPNMLRGSGLVHKTVLKWMGVGLFGFSAPLMGDGLKQAMISNPSNADNYAFHSISICPLISTELLWYRHHNAILFFNT